MAKGELNVVTKANLVRSNAVSSFLSLSKKILGLKRSSLARKCTSLNDPFEETTLTAQFLTNQDFSTSLSLTSGLYLIRNMECTSLSLGCTFLLEELELKMDDEMSAEV